MKMMERLFGEGAVNVKKEKDKGGRQQVHGQRGVAWRLGAVLGSLVLGCCWSAQLWTGVCWWGDAGAASGSSCCLCGSTPTGPHTTSLVCAARVATAAGAGGASSGGYTRFLVQSCDLFT